MGAFIFHIEREKSITVTFVYLLTASPCSKSFSVEAVWENVPPRTGLVLGQE